MRMTGVPISEAPSDSGATVIAEGIQSAEEARALVEVGIDYGQGFYLARPEPGPE